MKEFLSNVKKNISTFFIRARTFILVTTAATLIQSPTIGESGLLSALAKLGTFTLVGSIIDANRATTPSQKHTEIQGAIASISMIVSATIASIWIAPYSFILALLASFLISIILNELIEELYNKYRNRDLVGVKYA